jgi:hypothetical protein
MFAGTRLREAKEHTRIAEALIEETEYFRRKKELKIKNAE